MKKINNVIIISVITLILLWAAGISFIYFSDNGSKSKDIYYEVNENFGTQKNMSDSDSDIISNIISSDKEDLFSEAESSSGTEQFYKTEQSSSVKTTSKKIIAIDPGHQGSWVDMSSQEPMAPGSSKTKAKSTSGTTGKYSKINEYELNMNVSLLLRTELESRGYKIVMTRENNNTAISNIERANFAYESGADIYVRIHANGSDSSYVNGALTMSPNEDNQYISHLYEKSNLLSRCIIDEYCKETEFKNLGIQYHNDMTGINWSKIPVTILEMGFMTNEHDDLLMNDSAFQKRIVEGIANGIDLYYDS